MHKRDLKIGSVALVALLLTLIIWRASVPSPAPAENLDGGRQVTTAAPASPPQATVTGSPDASPQPVRPEIPDLLTDEKLSEPAVRNGLAQIVLDAGRKADERNEALSHLLNLTGEEEQPELLRLVRERTLEPELVRRVFTDAFNRPHAFQADLCLELMTRRDAVPLMNEAREHLLFLLGPEVERNADPEALKAAAAAAKKRWAEEAAQ